MGVKTVISLSELNRVFPAYKFRSLIGTSSGIIDTTYIANTDEKSYILKRYEMDVSQKIDEDIALLNTLKRSGLNVPSHIEDSEGWHLYERLTGIQPIHIKSYHIQALARFLAKMHRSTYKKSSYLKMIERDEIKTHLFYVKANFFGYYKKLQFLNQIGMECDGVIHGDIFKDNTVFNGMEIGVFDFMDSASGSFAFDAAVALVGFDVLKHKEYYINLFLRTYNQKAPRKLGKKELLAQIKTACGFYALKRTANFKTTKTARELVK